MQTFLVVGTGRSGLGYTSQVLTYAGIPCGHRWVEGPGPRRYPHVEIKGDASPLAAPSAQAFAGLLLHQVRDPLLVIGSLLGTGLLRDPARSGLDGEFLVRHFAFTGLEIDDAMRFYVAWNLRCERPDRYLRYRVEDLDAALLRRMAELIGHDPADATLQKALARVPRDFNTQYNRKTLSWSDLPAGPAKEELSTLAVRYGYPGTDAGPLHAPAA